jgi:hypothetical protein
MGINNWLQKKQSNNKLKKLKQVLNKLEKTANTSIDKDEEYIARKKIKDGILRLITEIPEAEITTDEGKPMTKQEIEKMTTQEQIELYNDILNELQAQVNGK